MAVDTAQKRFSMMGLGDSGAALIPPDGTIAQSDRATFAHLYSGITLSNIVVVVVSSRLATSALVRSLVKNQVWN